MPIVPTTTAHNDNPWKYVYSIDLKYEATSSWRIFHCYNDDKIIIVTSYLATYYNRVLRKASTLVISADAVSIAKNLDIRHSTENLT